MEWTRTLGLILLVLSVALACGDKGEEDHKGHDDDEKGHAAEPEHGGKMIEIGACLAHIEFLHHPEEGKVEIYLHAEEDDSVKFDGAPELKIMTETGLVVVATTGSGEKYTATHDALKADPLNGRIAVMLGGKPYSPDIPAHAHK